MSKPFVCACQWDDQLNQNCSNCLLQRREGRLLLANQVRGWQVKCFLHSSG